MNVLVTGATGSIGSHLARALVLAGHTVIAAQRQPSQVHSYTPADFARDHESAVWLPRLRGIDAVINAVGIIRETGSQRFADLHTPAPRALFDACVTAGVTRVLQISALGASDGTTGYFTSKRVWRVIR
ncbi:NAD-dependent epimerase/dehydratase family protein [Povalibacter sp.]|uniref:NAD-dependent epimerase/dehydratase family protein n=1 Tax=Povalibacter sp. TaxID=1962978 RepID=UPI002F41D262